MQTFEDFLGFLQHGAANGRKPLGPLEAVLVPAAGMAVALTLGAAIGAVYRRTYRGLQYSRSFVFALALLPAIVGVMITVIGGSVAMAFGAFGALSLIRFRVAIKDNVDLAFVFLAIAVGFCVGSGNTLTAVTAAVVLLSAVAVLSRLNFGAALSYDHLLRLRMPAGGAEAEERCREVFGQYLTAAVLVNLFAVGEGVEMTYSVRLRNAADARRLVEELSQVAGVGGVGLSGAGGEVET
jgi:uncharacterized membrane protein YhiD involved in acid resistance